MPSNGDGTGEPIPSGGGPLVFVMDLDAPVLDDADHHHLSRVRRVRDGEAIILADGTGAWRRAEMSGSHPVPAGPILTALTPPHPVAVAFALSKGDKPEWCVQKLTELGVDRIIPFVAARSVVRWDEAKRAAALERFQRVAREAAMQSRSARVPLVEPVATFDQVASVPGAARADRDGSPPSTEVRCILVGPEGGWDEAESASPVPTVGLADGVLRAETAAIVAGAVLTALRAGLVAPVGTERFG